MLTGLPKDPILLLSVVNTKLRDEYKNLDALCEDLSVEKEKLTETLRQSIIYTMPDRISLYRNKTMLAILREKNFRR